MDEIIWNLRFFYMFACFLPVIQIGAPNFRPKTSHPGCHLRCHPGGDPPSASLRPVGALWCTISGWMIIIISRHIQIFCIFQLWSLWIIMIMIKHGEYHHYSDIHSLIIITTYIIIYIYYSVWRLDIICVVFMILIYDVSSIIIYDDNEWIY